MYALLALVAVVATTWTITATWEWTTLAGVGATIVSLALAGLLGVFDRGAS